MLRPNDPAPVLAGTALDGSPVDLAALRGRPAAVAFFKTNCPWCRSGVPLLAPVMNRYADEVPTICVGVGHDTEATMRPFAAEAGIKAPIILDSDRRLRGSWSVTRVPGLFFIDANGRVVERYNGMTDRLPDAADQTYRALLGRADFPDYDEDGGG